MLDSLASPSVAVPEVAIATLAVGSEVNSLEDRFFFSIAVDGSVFPAFLFAIPVVLGGEYSPDEWLLGLMYQEKGDFQIANFKLRNSRRLFLHTSAKIQEIIRQGIDEKNVVY